MTKLDKTPPIHDHNNNCAEKDYDKFYFIKLTRNITLSVFPALTREATEPLSQEILVRKLLTDKCVLGCIIETVQNPRCSAKFCASKCLLNPRCTVFCLEPSSFPGEPCKCILQAQPGVPASPSLYYSVVGGSYYEMIN